MKRLVLVVEGRHDGPALANLVNTVIGQNHVEAFGGLFVDPNAVRAGGLPQVSGVKGASRWLQYLRLAIQRDEVGGVLAVFDGDEDAFEDRPFCAVEAARTLAVRASAVGAGALFSLAVVILLQEFESLLIAAGGLPGWDGAGQPAAPEVAPRDAKDWLNSRLAGGYTPVADQLRLTQSVRNWSPVRDKMRCFRRLEHAVAELVTTASTGRHLATPAEAV